MVASPRRSRREYSLNVRSQGFTLRQNKLAENAKKLFIILSLLRRQQNGLLQRLLGANNNLQRLATLALTYVVRVRGFVIVQNPRFTRSPQLLADYSDYACAYLLACGRTIEQASVAKSVSLCGYASFPPLQEWVTCRGDTCWSTRRSVDS